MPGSRAGANLASHKTAGKNPSDYTKMNSLIGTTSNAKNASRQREIKTDAPITSKKIPTSKIRE